MRKIISIAVLLVVLLGMAGCGAKSDTVAAKSDASDDLYIGVYCLGNLEYFYDHKIGLKAAGDMLGVQTKYTGPADYDITAMINAFEQAIAEKPDGIIVFGAEDTLLSTIDKAQDAGIPVVTVDGDVSASKRLSFVGTGSYDAGLVGGHALAQAIGSRGDVAILTVPDAELHRNRARGYQDALAQYPNIRIVQIGDTKSDPVHTIDVTKAILQSYPDLAGIGCTDAVGGGASSTAVQEAGLTGQIKIVSMDRDQQVLEKIVQGTIYGTLVQNSALMPFMALEILYNLKHATVEVTKDNAAAGFYFAPNFIDTGVVFVDAKTAQYYMRDN
ncbi:MAG: substrate-binding domain-containing protein [Treponema sp.]|jgi:ribose transport system substrate-binding protein|nr:substrate-binding domain-containing protein [Treponema sp.]